MKINKAFLFLVVFSSFFSASVFSQIVNLPCQFDTDGFIGLDRNNWNNGSTVLHSEGTMHNFTLPANTFGPCKKIEQIDIIIDYSNVDESGLPGGCGVFSYFTNIYAGCSSFTPASCFLFDQSSQNNPVDETITFTCPPYNFDFGDLLGVDIVPAMDPPTCSVFQSALSSGSIILEYEICIVVTIGNEMIDVPVDLGMDQTICAGETTPLDAGFYTDYSWLPNNESSQFITATGSAAGITYEVTVTDANGCTDTDQVVVFESAPSVTITENDPDNTICNGETIVLTANTTASNILWSTNQSSTSISVFPGNYSVEVTDDNNCTATASIQIDEYPIPSVSLVADMTTVCGSDLATITATSGFFDYDWDNGDNTEVITVGSGTYTLVVTDINGCEATETIQIFGQTAPNAGSNANIVVCNDGSTYDLDGNLGLHDFGGIWSDVDGAGVDVNTDPFAVSFLNVPTGFYDFSYTVFGTSPCPDDDATIQVEVVQGADAGNSNSITICSNDAPVDFFDEVSTTDLSGFWTDLNGSGVDLSNPASVDFSGVANGVYSFQYEVLANAPCNSAMSTLTVTVDAAASAGIDVNVSVCEGSIYNLEEALDVLADMGGSFSDDSNTMALTGSMFNTAGFAGQTLTFTYTVGSINCGMDQAEIIVNVVSSVSAGDNTSGNIFCLGEVIDLFAVLNNEDAGGAFMDLSSTGALTGNLFDTQISGLGTFNLLYQIGDNVVCPLDESMIEITIVEAPSIAMGEAFELCPNECSEFLVVIDGQGALSYTIDIFEAPNINTLSYSVTGANPDAYFIWVCNAAQNSISNDTIFLEANSLTWSLVPSSITDDQCTNEDVTIDTVSINTYSAYSELIEQDLCSDDSLVIANIVFDADMPSGMVDLNSINGCDSTIFVDLNILDTPILKVDDELCTGDAVTYGGIMFNESNPSDTIILDAAAINGCDSIIEVDLSFVQSFNTMDAALICQGDSIEIGGQWLKDEGVYSLQLTSVQLCDSIVEFDLGFYPPASFLLDAVLCEGGMIVVNGTVYDESNPNGTEIIDNASINGCDSTVIVDLGFSNEIIIDLEQEVCPGDSVMIDGVWYSEAILVSESDLSSAGCDSITNTNVVFFPESIFDLQRDLCDDESIVINGTVYDKDNPSGTEILEDADQYSCDSIINIALSFVDEIITNTQENICVGDSIFLGGDWQFNSGIYSDDFVSAAGCDSTVLTNLIVDSCSDLVTVEIINNVCANDANGSICVILNTGPVPLTVGWENTGTGEVGASIISAVGQELCISGLISGEYVLQYLATDGSELGTGTYNIQDVNTALTGNIIVNNSVDCFGINDGEIEVDVSGGTGSYSYSWSPSLGQGQSLSDLAPGTYEVIVTDTEQCSLFLSVELAAPQELSFETSSTNASCIGVDNGSISISNIQSGTQNFTITSNGVELLAPFELTDLGPGNYNIVLTDALSCMVSNSVTIEDEGTPLLTDYTDSYTIEVMDSITFIANYDNSIDSVVWTPQDQSISCGQCFNPVFSPTSTTLYTLTVYDLNGCAEEIPINVIVTIPEVDVFVPNIFSPNNDGVNDVFNIGFSNSVVDNYSLSVFDRWGNRIYDENLVPNSEEGWDGKYKGSNVQPGVYVFMLRYTDPNRGDIYIGGNLTVL